MLARVSNHDIARNFHRLSDTERLAKLRAEAEIIAMRHANGELSAEQATEELGKLTIASSNGWLRLFGL